MKMNENLLNRRLKNQIWDGYLCLSSMKIEKNQFLEHKRLDSHIDEALSKQHWV